MVAQLLEYFYIPKDRVGRVEVGLTLRFGSGLDVRVGAKLRVGVRVVFLAVMVKVRG